MAEYRLVLRSLLDAPSEGLADRFDTHGVEPRVAGLVTGSSGFQAARSVRPSVGPISSSAALSDKSDE